ncbi:putative Myb family transcription factor At1g14600 [Cryptomeria japonica]|uniref:putative Myb family transcription factor At1g14600 n=1 Tax=Cryptomeria japonica TaxID=3369 RepID=UPI0027DA4CF9|nr:putative Myb family transcription factor At1g14600 [Cryptomeria japonica]
MENEEGREILIFGKRIRVGGENNGSVSHENGNEKGEKRKYIKSLMPRIRWTSDLHDSFLRAVQQLGGPNKASPKQLVELMGVEGLTHPQVKSHLQGYRCKLQKPTYKLPQSNAALVAAKDCKIDDFDFDLRTCRLIVLKKLLL